MDNGQAPDIIGRVIAYLGSRHPVEGYDRVGNYRIVYWGEHGVALEERYTVEKYVAVNGADREPPVTAVWTQEAHAEGQAEARMLLKMVVDIDQENIKEWTRQEERLMDRGN